MEQKKHVSSSASRNLKSSFLVTRILCKNLNENCLSLLSLVESYMNENFFSHSECSSAKSIFLYKARTKLKNTKATDLFPGFASAVRSKDRLFINENLTNYRRRLVDSANQRQRDGCITSVWTMDGKVYVKTSPYGNPTRIFSENDLDDL